MKKRSTTDSVSVLTMAEYMPEGNLSSSDTLRLFSPVIKLIFLLTTVFPSAFTILRLAITGFFANKFRLMKLWAGLGLMVGRDILPLPLRKTSIGLSLFSLSLVINLIR